jgi:hypothetical protein
LKTVAQFVSHDGIEGLTLPEYHSLYFDVARNRSWVLKPVPSENEIMAAIQQRYDEHEASKRRQVVRI